MLFPGIYFFAKVKISLQRELSIIDLLDMRRCTSLIFACPTSAALRNCNLYKYEIKLFNIEVRIGDGYPNIET
jgi:hypothetical protein